MQMRGAFLFLGILVLGSALGFEVERIYRETPKPVGDVGILPLQPFDEAAWVWMKDVPAVGTANESVFIKFAREFEVCGDGDLEIDVSSDERHVLLLDGRVISRGPHRGLPTHWYYQTYRLTGMSSGCHRLEAVVWSLGEQAPISQLSWRGGFALKAGGAYDKILTTGKGAWTCSRVFGTTAVGRGDSGTYGGGTQFEVRGSDVLHGGVAQSKEQVAEVIRPPVKGNACGIRADGWRSYPTRLPDMVSRSFRPGVFRIGQEMEGLLRGQRAEVLAQSKVRILWDLGDYYCAYPELRISRGKNSRIVWAWTESLRDAEGRKGDRNGWMGKTVSQAMRDAFLPDGRAGASFTTPWWRCGRWCEILIETAEEPLTIESLSLDETRYPLENESSFSCDWEGLAEIQSLCVRGMQMCSHETSMDCPYYEQQMYPGDSRIQFLVSAVMSADDRLVRQNVSLFDYARRESGMIPMNFPTRGEQDSATYSMCWLLMLRDFLWEFDNAAWVRDCLPGMRHTLSFFASHETKNGLLGHLPGWNFVDWAGWENGVPPADGSTVGSVINLYYALTLRACADIEAHFGENEVAVRLRQKARKVIACVMNRCWCEEKGLIADTEAKCSYSEHAQCLGLLCGAFDGVREDRVVDAMINGTAEGYRRASVYFSHYVFEVLLRHGRTEEFFRRLQLWRDYLALGLKTPLESPGAEARSDCHAWGAHPLYHLHRGVLGIRPSHACFREVSISPSPGSLKWIEAKSVHPKGVIVSKLAFGRNASVSGAVALPEGLSGWFHWGEKSLPLKSGKNIIEMRRDD